MNSTWIVADFEQALKLLEQALATPGDIDLIKAVYNTSSFVSSLHGNQSNLPCGTLDWKTACPLKGASSRRSLWDGFRTIQRGWRCWRLGTKCHTHTTRNVLWRFTQSYVASISSSIFCSMCSNDCNRSKAPLPEHPRHMRERQTDQDKVSHALIA